MLNAFRHHGIGHPGVRNEHPSGIKCSTPSGIMESVTRAGGYMPSTAKGAQRLPASWNRSRPEHARRLAVGSVLNAFRHHGIGHSSSNNITITTSRAQRLPASWNRSHCHGHQSRGGLQDVLNAFRHHGIGHWIATCIMIQARLCSTPSGIMESVTTSWVARSTSRSRAQRLPASWNRSHHRGLDRAVLK